MGALVLLLTPGEAAYAAPLDPWKETGIDCTGPEIEAEPGTQAFTDRDARNVACTEQRRLDTFAQPLLHTSGPTYGQDPYRMPERQNGVRWRFTQPTINGAASVELYKPCASGTCQGTPAGLQPSSAPYPVVIVVHGGASTAALHRFNSQAFAEAGYMVLTPNFTNPPGVQTPEFADRDGVEALLKWLAAHEGEAADADLDRIAIAGHSQGGQVTLSYQGDARISALLDWDADTTETNRSGTPEYLKLPDPAKLRQPLLMLMREQGFAAPERHDAASSEFGQRPEPKQRFDAYRGRGIDVMSINGRAVAHTDFNGNGGPAANRLWEPTSNYYNLAWLDRHLKGKVLPGAGLAERTRRQAIARDAFDRLRAARFDDSADIHNISLGFWDPDLATATGDPLYGGNVPFTIAGLAAADRMSFYFRSGCSISAPDYVTGGIAARAVTPTDPDMRRTGCSLVEPGIAKPPSRRCATVVRLRVRKRSARTIRRVDAYVGRRVVGRSRGRIIRIRLGERARPVRVRIRVVTTRGGVVTLRRRYPAC